MSKELQRKQKAYVLIRVQPGKEIELYDELKQIPNITGIDLVRTIRLRGRVGRRHKRDRYGRSQNTKEFLCP